MIGGITGHREFENSDWVRLAIEEVINEMQITYGFTCLAAGADELFAKLLRERSIGYTAVIPCKNYENIFETREIRKFKVSKNFASALIELDHNILPTEKAFNEAGKLVVDKSNLLIAVWDGQKAKGLGGTGDIVRYAKEKNVEIIHLNPMTKSKNYINHVQ